MAAYIKGLGENRLRLGLPPQYKIKFSGKVKGW